VGSFPEQPQAPAPPDEIDRPRIGVDEWVAQAEERHRRGRGFAALLGRGWETAPPPVRLLLFVALAATLPLWMNEGDLFSYGLYTLLYAILALGLNIVVGFAGLLDLGYVAFYGFGAYSYALLSSSHYGIHWQAEASIPVAVAGAALVGVVLGFSSRRLLGDYLAIVTLFFGQAFVAFANNANPTVAGVGLTGGPNGIPNVDPLDFFGYRLHSTKQYTYFLLGVLVLVASALYFVNNSRTGRAWRALREDPLAAEAMSMPVNKLKLLAFVFGAGTAGLCGTIFAAIQTGTVAGNFDVSLLITIYAIVILGGMGSIGGAMAAAILLLVINDVVAVAWSPTWAPLVYFAALVIVLSFRPQGLFGSTLARAQ
jgi:branched-chain amino acid transport system permease protein